MPCPARALTVHNLEIHFAHKFWGLMDNATPIVYAPAITK